MITRETAARIWECYREIEVAEQLLKDMAETEEKYPPDPNAPRLKDAFGRRRHMQLGVPSGDNSRTLFNVPPQLARSVVRAHIEAKRAELAEANEQARLEVLQPQGRKS